MLKLEIYCSIGFMVGNSSTSRMEALSEWSLSDRLNLIRRFFTQEAGCVGKKIIVGSELLICLLLYPCRENLRQLHTDIRMGCANAYMRCYEQKTDSLTVTASDMPDYVRRGLLSIKEHRTEIEELIPQNYNFSFSSQGVHAQRLESADIKDNLYDCNGPWRVHQLPHPAQLRVPQQGQPCQADRLVCAGLLRHHLHRLCGNVVSLSTGCLSM